MDTEHIHHLLLVYAAYLVAVASPGPSTTAIMGVALSRGRASAVTLALGIMTGSMIWAVLAAAGISTVLANHGKALFVIKTAGGLYLLYLAYRSARSAISVETGQSTVGAGEKKMPLFRKGVLLHLSNPKSVLGWIAILSIGLRPDAPSYQPLMIVVGCALLGLLVNVGYAVAFSTELLGRAYKRSRRWIEAALALFFGYAGFRLLISKV